MMAAARTIRTPSARTYDRIEIDGRRYGTMPADLAIAYEAQGGHSGGELRVTADTRKRTGRDTWLVYSPAGVPVAMLCRGDHEWSLHRLTDRRTADGAYIARSMIDGTGPDWRQLVSRL